MEYAGQCKICNGASIDDTPVFTPEQQEKLLNEIYLGIVTSNNLPLNIYETLANVYIESFNDGYGIAVTPDTKPIHIETINNAEINLHHFAAAKLYQLVSEIEVNRVDYKNGMVNYTKFKEKSSEDIGLYLGAFLFTERATAADVGRAKINWNKKVAVKNKPSFLQYVTKRDGGVRPAHAALDGLIWKSDDRFMCRLNAPNGYRCRCHMYVTPRGTVTDMSVFNMDELFENIPPEFRFNFGDEKFVYAPNHPYFKVPRKDQEFARKNFNLPYPHGN
jgi:SPP1 gp7 family putative phage head morphogenesis protein